jgi:hypothetical protein
VVMPNFIPRRDPVLSINRSFSTLDLLASR